MNVDFEDVRTVMGEPGKAMMGTATASAGPRPHRRRAGRGLPAAGRHRPVGRQGRAGAGDGVKGSSSWPSRAWHEHHQRLRLARCARHLRRRLRRFAGRRDPRHRGRHRPVARQAVRRQTITVVQGGLRTGTDNVPFTWMPIGRRAWARGGITSGHRRVAAHGGNLRRLHHGRNRINAAARVDAPVRAAWMTGHPGLPAQAGRLSGHGRRWPGLGGPARVCMARWLRHGAWDGSPARRQSKLKSSALCSQRTLKFRLTRAVGVGLHSGERVELTLRPAPPDTGIVFRRVDLPEPVDIPGQRQAVVDTRLASTISRAAPRCTPSST